MLLASCVNGNREYDEADYSAFGTFVHALDTTEQRLYLTHLLDADSSRWEADKAVRKYYAERTHEPLWYTREGVTNQADSLLTQLQRELPQHGLNLKAFFLSEIEDDLEIVHKLAFDSVGQSITRDDHETITDYGDIVLYSGDQIVVFYGTNTWEYTRLGHIDLSQDELEELLGNGDVTIQRGRLRTSLGASALILQSGAARTEAHQFYEHKGFNGTSKRAFDMRLE